MSDSNLTEKITDSITNVMKKTKVFDELKNIQFYFGSFVLVSSIVGITSVVIHYFNAKNIEKNQKDISILREDIITYNKNILLTIKQLYNEDKFVNLEKILENHFNILNEIKNLPLLSIGKIDKLSRSTSVSSIVLDSPPKKVFSINSDEGWHIEHKEQENKEQGNKEQKNKEQEQYDFFNECYDNIPLSNVKKVTGIKNWFV